MRRLLVFVLVLYLVWRVLNIVGRSLERRSREMAERGFGGRGRRDGTEGASRPEERLVACSRCGTLVPASRALTSGGGPFCSESCREESGRGGGPVSP